MDENALDARIAALSSRVRAGKEHVDDATRLGAIAAAKDLLAALENPAERVIQDVVLNPTLLMALRMGVQLDVFKTLRDGDHGATVREIADKSGSSVLLVEQIMRLLTASGYAIEEDIQQYKPSPLTMAMSDSTIAATTRTCFDIGNTTLSKSPEYFRKNSNQFPGSAKTTPFQLAFNTELSYFDWLAHNPEMARDFQQWMTLKQRATPTWLEWYDVKLSLLDGLKNDVLLVDVGGGEGHYLHSFSDRFPHAPGRLVLQDLPHVISSITDPPKNAELMAHDFFSHQPVKGARAYYLHWILHDWPDEQARVILRNIVDAMEPGYSRLIINEQIIPDKGCDFATACISIMMMIQVGALERTEKQWRGLLASVGLDDVRVHQSPGGGEGIIEAVR